MTILFSDLFLPSTREVWGVTPSTRFPLFQVRLICSASTPLSSLFLHQPHDSELEQNRIMMDDLGLSQVVDINIISFYYKTAYCFWFDTWLHFANGMSYIFNCWFAASWAGIAEFLPISLNVENYSLRVEEILVIVFAYDKNSTDWWTNGQVVIPLTKDSPELDAWPPAAFSGHSRSCLLGL